MTHDDVFSDDLEQEPPDSDGQWEAPTSGDGTEYGPETEPRKRGVDLGLFSKFPRRLFGSGLAQKLGPSACVLYIALCEYGNRNNSNSFKARDRDLAWETALSPRTIRNVRGRLYEYRLVQYHAEPGQNYTYTLLRQELTWIKTAERPPRQKQRPRGAAGQRGTQKP